jgi:transcriptional regulator with XRE-family HTH domain
MRALLSTEFATLLDRADLSQAAFARLAGVTARQVNKWARGGAAVPQWAALLAAALMEQSADALIGSLAAAKFSWAEVLGVSPDAEPTEARRAMTRLAVLYHPDKGGTTEQMVRINKAYEEARKARSGNGARRF